MILRDAAAADLDAIAEILNREILAGTASWRETPWSAPEMARWLEQRQEQGFPVIVAEEGGEVLGYASYGPFRAGEGYAQTVEHSVYVARRARGRGIARLLMQRLIARARAAGLHRMVGGVSADQRASLELHRRLGFEEQGRLSEVGIKRGRRLDLALMVLALDDRRPEEGLGDGPRDGRE